MAARPRNRMAARFSCLRRLSVLEVELQEIDRQKDHVKEDDGIDVREQAVGAEQDVARQRKHPKRSDRGHAETGKNRERSAKAKAVDPRHDRLAPGSASWCAAMSARGVPRAW